MKPVFFASADRIPDAGWARLVPSGDPFLSAAFLGPVEKVSLGGTAPDWDAAHLGLEADGVLAALLPLYRRDHSFGDFSRDWGWAQAWQRAGLAYYPKLVSGIPYTPSPGPRLLAADDAGRDALIEAALATVAETGASSWQCLFVEEADRARLEAAGLLMRRGVQFHWRDRGYRDFDDFLAGFTAEKRKKLKRERRAVREAGLEIRALHGDELTAMDGDDLWPAIHRHYRDTFLRHGNHPALSETFFREVAHRLGRRMVVFVAFLDQDHIQTPVASAICYRDATTLHGRHWGADLAVPGLHFELCYYQGIDYCLREGLARFAPGAQGEHKLARGFEPVPTWSAFWIAHPAMRRAVADFVRREDEAMLDYEAETAERLPFKR